MSQSQAREDQCTRDDLTISDQHLLAAEGSGVKSPHRPSLREDDQTSKTGTFEGRRSTAGVEQQIDSIDQEQKHFYDTLPDPLGDRQVKFLPAPPNQPMQDEVLFSTFSGQAGTNGSVPNWRMVRQFLQLEGKLTKDQVLLICRQAIDILRSEANLLRIAAPVVVVGDIHGQLYDLCNIMEKAGCPSEMNYLFLGNYVDHGEYGLQVVLLLLCIKLNFPDKLVMLRGNHESRSLTKFFNFKKECLAAYDDEVYQVIMEVFDCLPLACVVNNMYLAVHGGISPSLSALEDINKIDRFQEIPLEGLLCDLVWSDPFPAITEENMNTEFEPNLNRDCSFKYGKLPVKRILQDNKLLSIIRSNQLQQSGFTMHNWDGPDSFPYVISLFSAPNFCDAGNNKGAVLIINHKRELSIKQFEATASPYKLPNNLDIFEWSLLFLHRQVVEMRRQLVRKGRRLHLREEEFNELRTQKIKQKAEQEKRKKMMEEKIKRFNEWKNNNEQIEREKQRIKELTVVSEQKLLIVKKMQELGMDNLVLNQTDEQTGEEEHSELECACHDCLSSCSTTLQT